jgi:hypothetical protein
MDEVVYVYCTFGDFALPHGLQTGELFFTFREHDGLTVVMQKQTADRLALPHQFECRLITLDVHSSLDAVGFLATISAALAAAGIACNAVSAFYHDHLLVPVSRAQEAVRVLWELREAASEPGGRKTERRTSMDGRRPGPSRY